MQVRPLVSNFGGFSVTFVIDAYTILLLRMLCSFFFLLCSYSTFRPKLALVCPAWKRSETLHTMCRMVFVRVPAFFKGNLIYGQQVTVIRDFRPTSRLW